MNVLIKKEKIRKMGVGKSSFVAVHMKKDMQVMIITIALLTQKNVTHNSKRNFSHPCMCSNGCFN